MDIKTEKELVSKAIENVIGDANELIKTGKLDTKEIEEVLNKIYIGLDEVIQTSTYRMLYQQIVLLAERSKNTDDIDELVSLTGAIANAHIALVNY